jgi:DNA-binding Xre family transcriptional regulator
MMFLNELMKEKNMTRADLSRISGIPESTLRDILSGKAQFDRCEVLTVACIADALGTTVEELLNCHIDEEFCGDGRLPKPERHDRSSMLDFYVMVDCTLVKLGSCGDMGFVKAICKDYWIERFYYDGLYRCAFFLLGLIDYLCRLHGQKPVSRFDALRDECLDQPVYSLRTMQEGDEEDALYEAKNCTELNAVPELACFNIYMTKEDIAPLV